MSGGAALAAGTFGRGAALAAGGGPRGATWRGAELSQWMMWTHAAHNAAESSMLPHHSQDTSRDASYHGAVCQGCCYGPASVRCVARPSPRREACRLASRAASRARTRAEQKGLTPDCTPAGRNAAAATAPDGSTVQLLQLADAVMIHRHRLSTLAPEAQLEHARLAARAIVVALHPDLAEARDLDIEAEIVEMRNLPQMTVPYVEMRVCSDSGPDQGDMPAVSAVRTKHELRPEQIRTESGRLRYSVAVRETLAVAVPAQDARGRLVLALCDGQGAASRRAAAGSAVSSTVGELEIPLAQLAAAGSVSGWFSFPIAGLVAEGWEGQAPEVRSPAPACLLRPHRMRISIDATGGERLGCV